MSTILVDNGDGTTSGIKNVGTVAEPLFPITFQAIKRKAVIPTLVGVAVAEKVLQAAASNAVLSARVALNAFDIVSAGEAIKNRFPDVKAVEMGEVIPLESDTIITDLYLVGLATSTNAGGNTISVDATNEVTIRSALLHYEFAAVDAVKTVEISLGSPYTSGTVLTPPLKAILRVEGFSHAA